MNKLLERAVEKLLELPAEEQERIAETILALTGEELDPEPIDPADLPSVLDGLKQATNGEFTSESEMEAVWQRFEK